MHPKVHASLIDLLCCLRPYSESVEDSSDRRDLTVCRAADDDTRPRVGGMDDLSVADIDADMSVVADQVAGLCFRKAVDCRTAGSLGAVIMRQ